MRGKSIVFLAPYPFDEAPSQRFRFEQYFNILEKGNYKVSYCPYFSKKAWSILYKDGKIISKLYHILQGFITRWWALWHINNYDYVFIHREATLIGPPIFEWIISRLFKKKIIYDFDDSIWLDDPVERNKLVSILKWKSKVANICRWSYKISVGNEYLASYASQFSKSVIVNPTTIDMQYHKRETGRDENRRKLPVIGWTGTHSTLQYLQPLIPVLKTLEEEYDFQFLVISNKKPDFDLKCLTFKKWNKKTEIEDLLLIDIGVMPLTNDPWSRGKCGFKALQYMALEIPALVSPIGVNASIVEHGITGYHCRSTEDWRRCLSDLLENENERLEIGKRSRLKIIKYYSVESNMENFLSLFEHPL